MFHRSVKLPKNKSFFLFGARGTGKSTLLQERFSKETTHFIDLLNLDVETRFARNPMALQHDVLALSPSISHIVIDEIQKLPKLLDVVHGLIETQKVPQFFILTGSRARKLKAGGANLLAGRAVLRNLFPLIQEEISAQFNEIEAMSYGGLPSVWNSNDPFDKKDFLRTYANTYLKEEVWGEQLVRQLEPFRRFLEVAAQMSGKIINASRIARDVGVDVKSVQSWYQILEDTLIGFHLDAFDTSVRKRLRRAPKFYLFDTGVTRALAHMLNVEPHEQTSYFGEIFEQLVVTELMIRNSYQFLDYQFFYLQTNENVEIDLIIQRPGKPLALVEIKSTTLINKEHLTNLNLFSKDFPDAELFLFSRDPHPQKIDRIQALHWSEGLNKV